MFKAAHQGITEVCKEQLLVSQTHGQHAVQELGDSLVLLQDRVHRPALATVAYTTNQLSLQYTGRKMMLCNNL